MKLTKSDIQFIDNYLKKKGIKYWDIRLEMIDHIATKIESYQGSEDFDTAFKYSLKELHWDKNLSEIHTQSWKTTNNIYRKKHFEEMITILKQPLWVLGLVFFYFGACWLSKSYTKAAVLLYFGIIVCPLIYSLFQSLKIWRMRLGRSVNMDYGIFYLCFGAMISGVPLQIIPENSLVFYLPFVLTFYLIMTLAGYRVYRFALRKVLIMKNID